MCVAISGLVKEISGDKAIVDFNGNMVEARAGLVSVEAGDHVLVHAGCIIQKVSKADADELAELFAELNDF